LEHVLYRLIRQPQDVTEWALQVLEAHRVFSRTDAGVIYCRRLVNDFAKHQERVRRAKEGRKKRDSRKDAPPAAAAAPPTGRPAAQVNGAPGGGAHAAPGGGASAGARAGASGGAKTAPTGGVHGRPNTQYSKPDISNTSPQPPSAKRSGATRAERERQKAAEIIRRRKR
jgi:hypothetical protein